MTDIFDYGYMPTSEISDIDKDEVARISAVHKERYEIVCKYGTASARLKSSVYYSGKEYEPFPTTGDFVRIIYSDCGDSQIIKTLPRQSFFSRRDPSPGRGEQAVSANFDYVFILSSLNHDLNIKRLQRYLTLSWQSGAVPVVILNKADLVDDYSEQLRMVEKVAVGVGVHAVSAKSGYGLDMLSEYLKPRKTIVFLGSSGVGKSSLLNALCGEEAMKVNDIREDDSKGRHTTTHRQLNMLPNGVMIIDTPGMRELGMWDVSEGLGEAFGDVEDYLGKCRFNDCTHGNEPGCAIKEAIENGALPAERWESYLQLKKEAKFTDDKAGYMKDKQQWQKDIAKWCKQNKKNGRKV
ncbi:MAG: ribosome small subunit-dependent GTPase A [Firmicutes bacterium HGW-Firmicutes-21]|nr:MAG: ribosome small subunit-dependent GTPase A [Firmicutes bacterium HGW-Firmicutes-21]